MKKIDYYRKIIKDISPALLEDADKELRRQMKDYGQALGFEFSDKNYSIYDQNQIRKLEGLLDSEKRKYENARMLYEKEKMGADGKVMLRKTDFTHLKNMRDYINELFERKEKLNNNEFKSGENGD